MPEASATCGDAGLEGRSMGTPCESRLPIAASLAALIGLANPWGLRDVE